MKPPASSDPCWIDGRPSTVGEASLGINDPAALWGLGVFETLARHGGRPIDRDEHLSRLALGARQLGIALPPEARLKETLEAAAAVGGASGWLKIVVTGGGRWFVWGGEIAQEDQGTAVSAVLLPWRRNPADPLVQHKTLSCAANRLGLDFARQRGADEGLWLNTRGHLAEGCTSNLFVIDGQRIFTPAIREGLLPGVVRGVVLTAAGRCQLPVHQGKVRLQRLVRADEAFLTSSVRGVRPLVAFEGRPVGVGLPGPTTRRLAREVARLRGIEPPEANLTTRDSADKL